ncbi:MAG: PCRF domain-containing protein, partial [Puniceicoccales bacterium]|nr:PCRF domain-containing protein [Puniceicoccales bacterium]
MDDIPSVDHFLARRSALEKEMAEPNFYDDGRQAAVIAREYSRLGELLETHSHCEQLKKVEAEAKAILVDPTADEDFKDLAREELARSGVEAERTRGRLLELMVPEDPDDSRNTIMEIRAGTGGDEAALFAGDLYRMYVRYAELTGWPAEILSAHGAECGGFKEVIFSVNGEG